MKSSVVNIKILPILNTKIKGNAEDTTGNATKNVELANKFNDHFVAVGKNLSKDSSTTQSTPKAIIWALFSLGQLVCQKLLTWLILKFF